jgi:hypothetical protein
LTRHTGLYQQAEITTEFAREAFLSNMERAHGGYQGISGGECQRCHKITGIIRVALKQAALGSATPEQTSAEWLLCQQCADELTTQTRGWVSGARS